jgi:hypothetical protein
MTTTAQELRDRIIAIEGRVIELTAERDSELAYEAIVTRDKKAIARVAEINDELTRLTNEAATLNAALKTALRREREAEAAAQADRKRADLERAESMLPEVEQLSRQIDEAMRTLHEATKAFDEKWATIRRLSGAGPHKTAINVHLGRSFRVGLRGLPGIVVDTVPPNERHSVTELSAGWSQQVRNLSKQKAASAA